jgi:hypothetical protein
MRTPESGRPPPPKHELVARGVVFQDVVAGIESLENSGITLVQLDAAIKCDRELAPYHTAPADSLYLPSSIDGLRRLASQGQQARARHRRSATQLRSARAFLAPTRRGRR